LITFWWEFLPSLVSLRILLMKKVKTALLSPERIAAPQNKYGT
jgi:hypothetical protein